MSAYALLVAEGGRRRQVGDGEHIELDPIGPFHLTLIAATGLEWLASSRALLIGRLFGRNSMNRVLEKSGLDAAVAGGLDRFERDYWGSYLLLLETADGLNVFRDPSAALPGYVGGHEGETFLVSDAGIAQHLGLLDHPAIDREFLVRWLQFPFLRSARTGLIGIRELQPGESLRLGGSSDERQIWKPASHCAPAHDDLDDAARDLRTLVRKCAPAVVGEERALLSLSGGLDSSIVAAALVSAGIRPKAVSFASLSADGDEQAYARAVAEHLGLGLEIVRESDAAAVSDAGLAFRPGANILLEGVDEAIEAVRQACGAEVIVSGGGGDSLFGFSATAGCVVDAMRAGRGWEAITWVAERSDASLWQVAWYALKKAVRRYEKWPEDRSFLRRDALMTEAEDHPWMAGIDRLPPGKREHVISLVSILHFLDRHSLGGVSRHPLMAQPLLEFCLSVPSWLWSAGGRDRAVARSAFRDGLPRSIIERRTKGSLEGYFERRFRPLKPALSELLLDGELAAQGVIDRATVEAALHGDAGGEIRMRLSEIATLERWLASWRRAGAR